MTQLPFFKYQATGNDFILIDNRDQRIDHSVQLAQRLCDRHFGIGSDGLILIQNHPECDFEMVFYNPDGSKSLCGNGSRCAVNFAKSLKITADSCRFMAFDGIHEATILADKRVRLKMNNVQSVSHFEAGMFIDTGSPHLLVFTEDVKRTNVVADGSKIRYSEEFNPDGVNVNFIELKSENRISVRTYERGVENETLSCGTGVTASALGASSKGLESPISIETSGGNLEVEFEKESEQKFKELYLIGPAEMVFSGTIKID